MMLLLAASACALSYGGVRHDFGGISRTPHHAAVSRSCAPRLATTDEAVTSASDGTAGLPSSVAGVVLPTTPTFRPIDDGEYKRGLATVAFITLLFASNSPALRAAFTEVEHVPPVLLVSAVASVTALSSLVVGGPLLASYPRPSTLDADATDAIDAVSLRAGAELGLWKALGMCSADRTHECCCCCCPDVAALAAAC
jgi:hypothetical protein